MPAPNRGSSPDKATRTSAAGSGSAADEEPGEASAWQPAHGACLPNRTIIEAFTARAATLESPEPSPLESERLPKHVRYLCATPRRRFVLTNRISVVRATILAVLRLRPTLMT